MSTHSQPSDDVTAALIDAAAWLSDAGAHRRYNDLRAARLALRRARARRLDVVRLTGVGVLPN